SFFLELMEHGIEIEKRVRTGLLEIARKLNMPLLASNDSHYVTQDQAPTHEALLCVGSGRTLDDPKRFRLEGDGYYLRTAGEKRALFPGGVRGDRDHTRPG